MALPLNVDCVDWIELFPALYATLCNLCPINRTLKLAAYLGVCCEGRSFQRGFLDSSFPHASSPESSFRTSSFLKTIFRLLSWSFPSFSASSFLVVSYRYHPYNHFFCLSFCGITAFTLYHSALHWSSNDWGTIILSLALQTIRAGTNIRISNRNITLHTLQNYE